MKEEIEMKKERIRAGERCPNGEMHLGGETVLTLDFRYRIGKTHATNSSIHQVSKSTKFIMRLIATINII